MTKEEFVTSCVSYQKEKRLKECETRKRRDDEVDRYKINNYLRTRGKGRM